jgi:hypothetical protein
VLPAFPFVFVYLGRAGQALTAGGWGSRLTASGLLLWAIGSYLSVHPHSLAYFNELAGGPEGGHWHLHGSNLDWGQDLLRLKRWLDAHPEAKPFALAYANHMDPRIIGIDFPPPPEGVTSRASKDAEARLVGPVPGYFAVSRRFIDSDWDFEPHGSARFQYFNEFQPIAKAGYSILIYHITLEQANHVRQEYGLPPLPPNWNEITGLEPKGPP